MKSSTLLNIADRYVSITGRQSGTRVVFEGDKAYTDGTTIVVPALQRGLVMSAFQASVFEGYLDHETAHIRHDTFGHFDIAEVREKDELLGNLWNLVEDVRIEREHIQIYPGAKKGLDNLETYIDKKYHQEEPEDELTRLCIATHRKAYEWRGVRYRRDQETLADLGSKGAAIEGVLQGLSYLQTSADSLQMAKELRAILPDPPRRPKPKGKNGPKMGMLGDKAKDALIKLLEDIGQHNQKLIKKGLKGQGNTRMHWSGHTVLPPYSSRRDRIFVPTNEDMARYKEAANHGNAEIHAIKKMTRVFLQSFDREAWQRGTTEGDLDREALAKLMRGRRDVRKERRHRKAVKTAVELMTDASGSMNDYLARLTMIVTGEALAATPGIKMEMASFTTAEAHYGRRPTKKGYGREEALEIRLLKRFDEPYQKARARIGGYRSIHYTPLGDAYAVALERIITRPEPRKIIWLITDGSPCYTILDSRHNDWKLLEETHIKAKALGVETICTFVGHSHHSDEFRQVTDHLQVVYSPGELAKSTLELLKETAKWEPTNRR